MTATDEDLVLDGNAVAGTLAEIYGDDIRPSWPSARAADRLIRSAG